MNKIITEIQSRGIQVPHTIAGRKGGAGPAEGRAFLIKGIPVNAPISAPYVADSPFTLEETEDSFLLLKHGKELFPVEVVPDPYFYGLHTEDGTSYRKIALLHGKNCLATTVIQKCVNWKTLQRCGFCGTEISLNNNLTIEKKTPEQLAEVAKAAQEHDGITHVVLTSGTADPPGTEIPYLAQCVRAVKNASGLPVHVQFLPPDDLGLVDELKQAGTDTAGIHIECFDKDVLCRIAPVKAAIGLKRYEQAWQKAVELFGPCQVSSFVIVGLGEELKSVAWGSELLADMGVYPFVVPLRPVPGSHMQDALPPSPENMETIYEAVAGILHKKGLSARKNLAGCVRCGACSALRVYEKEKDMQLICHSARTGQETARAFEIRKQIFVREQNMFKDSDKDEHDNESIHLVAKVDGKIIGTVRVFPGKKSGHWIGSRLAVLKESRSFHVGILLVKEAIKRVKKKGCTVFTAHIQEKNINFFSKLGWKPVGSVEDYLGRPHQVMQADLDRVPDDL
ncbi:MAG: MSMEG_0568 family radical SAM protein [Desulfobacterales bacterium]|nr:MSMEG_0568 family radical SAM protein [Desulfobacterales bacterium]